jgi:hypothetical protein
LLFFLFLSFGSLLLSGFVYVQMTLSKMLTVKDWPLIDPAEASKKGYQNSGVLSILLAEIVTNQGARREASPSPRASQVPARKSRDELGKDLEALKGEYQKMLDMETQRRESQKKIAALLDTMKAIVSSTPEVAAQKVPALKKTVSELEAQVKALHENLRVQRERNKAIKGQ